VEDKTGVVAFANPITITVEDPSQVFSGQNTYCFSRSGDFSGCPQGAQQQTTTDLRAAMSLAATGKRLLFKRGEVWTFSTIQNQYGHTLGLSLGHRAGPIAVGAYGNVTLEGPLFRHDNQADEPAFDLSNSKDIRISDVQFEAIRSLGGSLISVNTREDIFRTENLLLSRIRLRGGNRINLSGVTGPYVFIYDSDLLGGTPLFYADMYGSGGRVAILGTNFTHARFMTDSLSPPELIGKTLISHNRCIVPEGYHYAVRHYAGEAVVSDNEFSGSTSLVFNAECTGCVRGKRVNLIERNFFHHPPDRPYSGSTLAIASKDIGVVRNNLFYQIPRWMISVHYSTYAESNGVVGNYGVPSKSIHIYNNTAYTTVSSEYLIGGRMDVDFLEVKNNLLFGSGSVVFSSTNGIGQWDVSNNFEQDPHFLNVTDPQNPGFLRPNPQTSPVVDAGAPVPAIDDFVGTPRPQGAGWDIGAFETW
jgi:hypothetical protein